MKQLSGLLFFLFLAGILCSPFLLAEQESYTIRGTVLHEDGRKVSGADVVLLDSNGNEVERTFSGKHQKSEGIFEFRRIIPGDYTVSAKQENVGFFSTSVMLVNTNKELELTLKPSDMESGGDHYGTGISSIAGLDMQQIVAELNRQATLIRNLQSKNGIWANPRAFYKTEIIFENGSSLIGAIIYQDESIIKVETLVGDVVINRNEIVQIVRNLRSKRREEGREFTGEPNVRPLIPIPGASKTRPRYMAEQPMERIPGKGREADVIMQGNIFEWSDRSKNIVYSGRVKNIGGRRADFTKVSFVFNKNGEEDTQTLTTFIKGDDFTFNSGVTTDASLFPGTLGTFELIVPPDFGSFIGYSYTIDWDENRL